MKKVLSVAAIAVMISLAGCDSKEEKTEVVVAPHVQDDKQGKVVEFSHVPGYTYALVEGTNGPQWFAGPSAELAVGQTVFWRQGAVMQNFTSKALEKSFESIMFIDGFLDKPASAAPVATVASSAPAAKGTVISAQASAGYLYLEIKSDSGNVWVAAPMADIKVGDEVQWSNASLMNNFSSKSLGRTFSEIYFAGAVSKIQ